MVNCFFEPNYRIRIKLPLRRTLVLLNFLLSNLMFRQMIKVIDKSYVTTADNKSGAARPLLSLGEETERLRLFIIVQKVFVFVHLSLF